MAEMTSADARPSENAAKPEPSPEAPSLEDLERRLEEAERRAQELLTKLQYAQADAENARKRADRDVAEAFRFANERLVASLLSVLDTFDAALASLDPATAKGVEMVYQQLVKALQDAGLEEVPVTGRFDPYLHEAVGRVDDPALEDGAIKEVVQKGYRFQFRLLRPAKVIVERKGGEP